MDLLSDVLRVVRLSGAVFFTAEFSSPWAIESPSPDLLASIVIPDAECMVLFHILMEGECLVEVPGHPIVTLAAGDVIVFPHGHPHAMRSDDRARPTSIEAVFSAKSLDELPQVSLGGGGTLSRFLCGYLNCDHRFSPLFESLPTMLLIRSKDGYSGMEAVKPVGCELMPVPRGSGTWLGTTLKFTVHEARHGRPGNGAMLGRLTELMFVEMLREYMQRLPTATLGWLAGLNDPHVGKALRLLHADPLRAWTVEALAHEVAVSRSSLAQRFTTMVGLTPMRYLAAWRMQLAKQMLSEAGPSVQDVATRVGYESEAAFNRAFKRTVGSPPAAWRRAALTASTLCAALVPDVSSVFSCALIA